MDDPQRIRDEWLALRCQSGDRDGFAALVAEMETPLLYYALKLVGRQDVAKDVVQEAWIKVSRTIHRLEKPGAIRAWLYRIVHGLAVDRVRRDTARERAEDETAVHTTEVIDDRLSAEHAEAVHHALDLLAPHHREVLVLFFLEDFSIAEISEVIGCNDGTVKSRLHYAKAALRAHLQSLFRP